MILRHLTSRHPRPNRSSSSHSSQAVGGDSFRDLFADQPLSPFHEREFVRQVGEWTARRLKKIPNPARARRVGKARSLPRIFPYRRAELPAPFERISDAQIPLSRRCPVEAKKLGSES